MQSVLDTVTQQNADQIQEAISQVNLSKFVIVAIQKFKNSNCFVQYVSFNEESTYMLCTCSDRALRLYFFDFMAIKNLKPAKGSSKVLTSQYSCRVIYLKNEIKDVINGRKWQNSAFIKLNLNSMIVDQYNIDYEKLESRGTGNQNGAGSSLCYGGNPLMVGQSYNNLGMKRHELFVCSMGETGANELKFYNLAGDSRENKCLQRVELTIDGCNYLTVHSKSHFTVLMASNNGSVFAWMARPQKLIQPLAPDFHEIERNIWYVEREDEFEEEVPDEAEKKRLYKKEQEEKKFGLVELDERQRGLAQAELDVDKPTPACINLDSVEQKLWTQRTELRHLDTQFPKGDAKQKEDLPLDYMTYISAHVSCDDQYAQIARNNLIILKEKFNNLMQH